MKISRSATFLLAVLVTVAPAAVALAQIGPPSIAGTWTLDANVTIEGEELPCVYNGTTTITQDGSVVSGPANLSLVSGPAACPGELSGTLTGEVGTGNFGEALVSGAIDGGSPAGSADFNGSFSAPMAGIAGPRALVAMALAMQAQSGNGSLNVVSGPFAGAGGTWMASAPAVPTLQPLGLLILVGLLLAAGYIVLRRQGLQRPA
ncbi:MAG: IPTL-CTERM sorting domain-containing protein [Acidobacteriota bacterium]|jgi:hypothetical protein